MDEKTHSDTQRMLEHFAQTPLTITITEALAEVKTIGSRITNKRQFIYRHLVRQEGMKDPLAAEGGSVIALEREEQAIRDLEERIVAIRKAIHRANGNVTITIEGVTRTIADWLVWRREVASGATQHVAQLIHHIEGYRKAARQKDVSLVAVNATATKDSDLLVNVDERALASRGEKLDTTLGQLDGKLSYINATTSIIVE